MLAVSCSLFSVISVFVLLTNGEKLLIDPLSIRVNPYDNQLCWDYVELPNNYVISGYTDLKKTKSKNYTAKRFHQFSKYTFCIYDNSASDIIPIQLPITESQTFQMLIDFGAVLGPQLDLIRFVSVPNGVWLQLHSKFAGITSYTGPKCEVLLKGTFDSADRYEQFQMNQNNDRKKYVQLDPNTKFRIYFSCWVAETNFMKTSTLFIAKSGNVENKGQTENLLPVLQMPLRRFIKAAWKQSLSKMYYVVVYENKNGASYECLKIFRIFERRLLNIPPTHPKQIKCPQNTVVEDVGYINVLMDTYIYVVLDMVQLLSVDNYHKFSIFWPDVMEKWHENYVFFKPIQTEDTARLNWDIFNFTQGNYENIANEIHDVYQEGTKNKWKNPLMMDKFSQGLPFSPFTNMTVVSSVMDVPRSEEPIGNTLFVDDLQKKCDVPSCNEFFYPYFYTIFTLSKTDASILQIPINPNKIPRISFNSIERVNNPGAFRIGWKLDGYPQTVSPAYYAIYLSTERSPKNCEVYLLKCSTCNSHYVETTYINVKKNITIWKKECTIKEDPVNWGRYSFMAVQQNFSFTTDKMNCDVIYDISIFAFKWSKENDKVSQKEFLPVSHCTNPKNIIIPTVSVASVLLFIGLLVFCCRWLLKDPPGSTKPRTGNKPKTEVVTIYDEDYHSDEPNKYYGEDGC